MYQARTLEGLLVLIFLDPGTTIGEWAGSGSWQPRREKHLTFVLKLLSHLAGFDPRPKIRRHLVSLCVTER